MAATRILPPHVPPEASWVTLPHASRAVIPVEKLRRYLLDPDHPRGGSKARFFLASGFSRDRPDELRRALLKIAQMGTVTETVSVEHGTKYVVDGGIETTEGRTILLRTVWILLSGEDEPRFVTAYPTSPGPR